MLVYQRVNLYKQIYHAPFFLSDSRLLHGAMKPLPDGASATGARGAWLGSQAGIMHNVMV